MNITLGKAKELANPKCNKCWGRGYITFIIPFGVTEKFVICKCVYPKLDQEARDAKTKNKETALPIQDTVKG
jgi:hypothetical protein